MKYFVPISPDPALRKRKGDGALARFGHLNILVDKINELNANQTINASLVQTQAAGTALIFGLNIVTGIDPGDTVTLPSLVEYCACTSQCGAVGSVIVKNTGTFAITIYPFLGETIDGQSVNTGLVLDAGASVEFADLNCNSWESYSYSTDPSLTGVNSVTGCGVNNSDPANPVLEGPFIATVSATQALTGTGCNSGSPLSVCIDNSTITKNGSGCLQVANPIPTGFGTYAEYVQRTQSPNNSIPPGQAISYTVDSPSGLYNTIGITTATGPGAIGTAFNLPIGVYMIDFENSAAAASSFAIYQGSSNTAVAIKPNTIAGSTTATSWIHGRAIVESVVGAQWIIVSSVVGTAAIPTAGTAAGEYTARITFLKIA